MAAGRSCCMKVVSLSMSPALPGRGWMCRICWHCFRTARAVRWPTIPCCSAERPCVMKCDDYTAANREAWDEAAPIHARRTFDQLLTDFRRPGHSCLDALETRTLRDIGLARKSVVQICCNNGRELLSAKNLGAGRCVGFDISDG